MIVNIEGSIGEGKSTFLRNLEKMFKDVYAVQEIIPYKKLEMFLTGKLDALGFQLIMASLRVKTQNEAVKLHQQNPDALVLMERSILSDACFAETCITEEEDLQWYHEFAGKYLHPAMVQPNLTVYLRGSLEGQTERITRREEEKLKTDYDKDRKGENWYLTEDGTAYRKRLNEEHDRVFLPMQGILTFNPDKLDFRDADDLLFCHMEILKYVRRDKPCPRNKPDCKYCNAESAK